MPLCHYCSTDTGKPVKQYPFGDPMGNGEHVPLHEACLPKYEALTKVTDVPIPRAHHFWMKIPKGIRWDKVRAELENLSLWEENRNEYPNLMKLLAHIDDLRGDPAH